MECDICSRPHGARRPFNCITCARNTLYELRIDHAGVLVEREELGKQVAQATSTSDKNIRDRETGGRPSRRFALISAKTAQAQVDHRVQGIADHMEALRQEIRKARQEISARKAALAQRKRTLEAVVQTVETRRAKTVEDIGFQMTRREQIWESRQKKLEFYRSYLCREAAKLYGLKRQRRIRNGVAVDQYIIGGLIIPDLREINNFRPEDLSAVIASVSHFVLLASHYLAVRLPAEIITPHRSYPRPTIFTPLNSYSGKELFFPGSTPSHSSSTSPTASRHGDVQPPPRPRPLYIEKRLPQLLHDDPNSYALFIEAISLLAWDIAWLSRSQGFSAGTDTWEEVCCIGKNLWQLFVSSPSNAALPRARSSRDVTRQKNNGNGEDTPPPPRSRSLPRLGQYSHGSAHTFLSGAEYLYLLRGWKLTRYATIVDPLKRTLLGEINNAEWELLEPREWNDGSGDFNAEETVFVRGRDDAHNTAWDDARSVMSVRPKLEAGIDREMIGDDEASDKAKGTKGWMKVKARDNNPS